MDVEALRERHVFKREMGATVQKPEATPPANPTTTDSANLVCWASCRHFQADEVGDGSGIGKCTVGGEGGTTDTPPPWPRARRGCKLSPTRNDSSENVEERT